MSDRVDPYLHMPEVDREGRPLRYGTQPGTYIDPNRRVIVTHTHRGEVGSWFTFRRCFEVYGFPQDADRAALQRQPRGVRSEP